MGILGFLRDPAPGPSPGEPKIAFGFRGEDITYQLGGRILDVAFTWTQGPRIHLDDTARWRGGDHPTEEEWARIFPEVVRFVGSEREKPTIVVDTDHPRGELWERLCEERRAEIAGVEHTSAAENRELRRKALLEAMRISGGLVIDGEMIDGEERLNEVLKRRSS